MQNPSARESTGPARRTVAVRIWDWSEWCRQVVRGVQRFAHERPGWRLYVDVGRTGQSQVYSSGLAVDGIITHVLGDVRSIKRTLAGGRVKVVGFAAFTPAPLADLPRVRVDDGKVAEVIGRHLTNGGFRRVAYCGGDSPATTSDARMVAVQAYAAAHMYPFDLYEQRPRKTLGIHMPSLTRWVAGLSKPVGIVTWNIEVARHVVEACARAGLPVPDPVAVVAWDDDPMLAETLEPTISAAVLPAERLGFEAARLLDAVFDGRRPTAPVVIDPPGLLRVRQSSDVSALKDREVHLAMQYIREHAAEPLKVPQVARHVGVSRKKLELDFARVARQTPREAIVTAHLELAKRLLLETDWPTTKVAERSGMGDEATLRAWFVKREGMRPGEYRQRYGSVHQPAAASRPVAPKTVETSAPRP